MSPHPSKDGIDLGEGHSYTWLGAYKADTDYSTTGADGVEHNNLVGIIEWHNRPDGTPCGGAVMFAGHARLHDGDGPGPEWTVVSLDPLHLEPSIHCAPEKGGCGSHGWIRDGRWIGA